MSETIVATVEEIARFIAQYRTSAARISAGAIKDRLRDAEDESLREGDHYGFCLYSRTHRIRDASEYRMFYPDEAEWLYWKKRVQELRDFRRRIEDLVTGEDMLYR